MVIADCSLRLFTDSGRRHGRTLFDVEMVAPKADFVTEKHGSATFDLNLSWHNLI